MLAGLYDGLSEDRQGRRGAAALVACLALLALMLLAAAGPLAPAAPAAKPKRADLAVGSATARLSDGRVTVQVTARNIGRRGAGISTGAVFWKPAGSEAKAVVLKRFALLAVANGGARKVSVSAAVPAETTAGRRAVSVCLDVRSRVRESSGENNCRSAGTVTVPDAGVSPVSVVSPAPVGAPALPGSVPSATTTSPGGTTTPPGGGTTTPPGGGTTTPPPPGSGTTPPDTAITQGPVGVTKDRTVSIWFVAIGAPSTFQCRLDDAAWEICPPIKKLEQIPDGVHTFEVRAVDGDGNIDPTPASRTWTVDNTPPQTTITAGPLGPVNTVSGAPEFSSSEDPAWFECRLGNGAWAACTSPHALTMGGEGSYTINVRAYDAAGNVDATPAVRAWTVDLTAPNTSLSGGPSGTVASATATFNLASSSFDQAGFECRLDGGDWASCSSAPQLGGLSDGQHTFEARTLDAAGNRDQTAESRTWSVDTTAPDTSLLSGGPSGTVATASAAFTFTSPEAGTTFECRVDGGAWVACASPRQLTALADGQRTFEVRALDALGNPDPTPASRTWTVDTTAPDTSITSSPPDAVSSTAATFDFSSADPTATFQCRLDGGTWAACTSPRQLTGLADGSHTFEVRALDPVGNTDTSAASRTWTVDTTAPNTSIATGPGTGTTVNSASATFTFSSPEANATFQCRLDNGAWEACASPHQRTGLADGVHTFDVRALDALGNPDASPATRTWTVDTTAPDTAFTSGPQGTVASSSATFAFSAAAADVIAFECRLDTGTWVTCTSPRQLAGLADGAHTFEVRAVDAAGNVESTPATRTWIVDTTAPDTSITSGPTGAVPTGTANFAFTSPDPTATFQCRLDGGTWAACTSPRPLSGLADGAHTFEVRALDPVGNIDGSVASRTWTVDTVAPNTFITAGPTGSVNSTSASLAFSGSEAGATFECRLDAGAWAACTSPRALSALTDGSHTFEVRATDTAGNVDLTPASRTWTVDTTFPETTLTNGPLGAVSSTSAALEFSSSEATATFQCRLDNGTWAACTSPQQLTGLAQGSHTFEVKAVDLAGNTDATPALRTWSVDTVVPDTAIANGPTGTVKATTASFDLSSPEQGVSFQCRLDGGAWAACTTPRALTGLTDGQHTFEARALDAAGNTDQTPATRIWTVDTTPPDTTLTSGPANNTTVASTSASLAFTSSEGSGTFECRLDAGTWSACTSPQQLTSLAQGSHTFDVRAIDTAGNVDASPATRTWTVDTAAPETSITSGPTGAVASTSATIAFSSADPTATFQCKLDAGAWVACTSPQLLTGLGQGAHTLEVRAVDPVGNADATPAARNWTVDTTVPDTSISGGPTGTVTSTSASFNLSSPEPGVTFECRLDGGAWAACTTPRALSGLADGTHLFEARAVDAAKNTDASPATRTWTVDSTPPDTTISAGPSGTVASASATFQFSSPEQAATFECRVDTGAWAACSSPRELSGLAEGPHTFEVRALDALANADATPASRSWTVDTTAPDTTITSGPAATTSSTDATLVFSSPEQAATFECSLDSAAWASCSSPQQLTALAVGAHTFQARAKDAVGNLDSSPASWSWTITAPAP